MRKEMESVPMQGTIMIGTGVHAVMGSGGAPEGVLTAAALGDGVRTSSLVMVRAIGSIRFVDTIHVNQTEQAHIRFA